MKKKNESSLEALYWLEQVADDDADLVLSGKVLRAHQWFTVSIEHSLMMAKF